mmetsp:Transcript_299/g.326  ORF Transcript_299/g.326 Transcript_299/m.326 type:complete len:280 (+) Transcript_299:87-926(+)|eukprot:CAMPEP_0204865614 /NCGR_PEP_ID=MMETSP1348-20121228/12006_1 /ASSEMBLY_ACC=CAM_ASM_000700 /TAXON_ID=215587 /ORGANISM="Aplanochytrium stocchinoi, Strain GSBS06" /LENGTH=279 /DNA_ID=CAMNT_0052017027 /DNA_START=22 /DNA_END=861 /DNA_ORIENTATION=+
MGRVYVWDTEGGPTCFQASNHIANASFCNLLAVIFALVAALSPYFLKSDDPASSRFEYVQYGTGVFSVSTFWVKLNSSHALRQTLYWDQLIANGAGCSNETNIYQDFSGRYGFCDRANGQMTKPAELKAIAAFVLLTVVFSGCTLVSLFCTRIYESWGLRFSAIFTILGMISSVLSFSLVAASEWLQDLLNDRNGVLPVKDTNTNQLVAITGLKLHYGPMYALMVSTFAILLLSCVSLCFAASIEDVEKMEELGPENAEQSLQGNGDTGKEPTDGIQLA